MPFLSYYYSKDQELRKQKTIQLVTEKFPFFCVDRNNIIISCRWIPYQWDHRFKSYKWNRACRESKNSDSWFVNQFKNWFESSMIRESFLTRKSLLIKKLWIFDSRINLESNHFKKDSNQLSLSVSQKKKKK